MPPSPIQVVLISAVPPGLIARSSIQHFAAGVIFSVVAVDLLPEVRRGHDPFEVGWTAC